MVLLSDFEPLSCEPAKSLNAAEAVDESRRRYFSTLTFFHEQAVLQELRPIAPMGDAESVALTRDVPSRAPSRWSDASRTLPFAFAVM